MNENLAARQEKLHRQNQELNQEVEAIEQRRQQLSNDIKPTSSSTILRGTRTASQSQPLHYKVNSKRNDEDPNKSKLLLEINLTESIDSLSTQGEKEACPQLVKNDKKEISSRKKSAESKRKNKQNQSEALAKDALHNHQNNAVDGNTFNDVDSIRDSNPKGLSLEATVRYQKARLRVLQDEKDEALAQIERLQATHAALKGELDTLKTENSALLKKNQQIQQLVEKQRELSVAQEEKQRILENQLASAQENIEKTLRAEKIATQQFRSKDVRLDRALEEIEKLKVQLQNEKMNHTEQMVTKEEFDQVVHDNKKLDKQKGELLIAFKKQMKLIDLLKRQRVHMEAAKMLSFTEAEFSKTLELG
ncbi:uncharacterized protein PHALS_10921 [Plasmopara halstedii]|uniref:Testis-expressed sequence 9 protein n=1 Tax=Plasmopara halstedii TaxID=4781 RepID=A0A0P1AIK6_PLAHL|nr:uncharacterized protein PHALS_10921 [Plasmopara halstedii]CEG40737.1 hypothetical protein PHALS_10921 [Plasmopara halstedii]|eukprot:XP_024577106.1 hypothetical protein PHALS_10921 [Plasmopara halstedii]